MKKKVLGFIIWLIFSGCTIYGVYQFQDNDAMWLGILSCILTFFVYLDEVKDEKENSEVENDKCEE